LPAAVSETDSPGICFHELSGEPLLVRCRRPASRASPRRPSIVQSGKRGNRRSEGVPGSIRLPSRPRPAPP